MNTKPSALVTALQMSLRTAVAVGLAVAIAQFFGLQNPILTLLAAIFVMDLSPAKTRHLALQRMAGTVLGAMVGPALSYILPPGPLAVTVSILTAMLLSYAARLPAAARMAGVVSGITLLAHAASPWPYAVQRTIETLLGITIAVLVSFVPKLLRVEIPEETDS